MFISLSNDKETVIASPYGRGGSRSETERVVCANRDCYSLDRGVFISLSRDKGNDVSLRETQMKT